MIELSLNDIQVESLKILDVIHDFCSKEGINYSLAYGTLIGAIRHKGFIPWDDDIDIIMPRSDYERFCSSFHNPDYELVCMNNDNSCLIAYARVCDIRNTIVKNYSWTKKDVGLWVDVFPIDVVEDNFSAFAKRYQSNSKKWSRLFIHRIIQRGENEENSKKMNFLIKTLNSFRLQWVNNTLAHLLLRSIDKTAKQKRDTSVTS